MKLLTLNTHSLAEADYDNKLRGFVSMVAEEKPHIIALQEVYQTCTAPEYKGELHGFTPCMDGTVVRDDNHALAVAKLLREEGLDYHWTWLPIKRGYGRFDEGIAVMSLSPILETDVLTVSGAEDHENWKTRRIVGVRTATLPDEWFFSVHYGRWDDDEEPFRAQWIRTAEHMTRYEHVWLLGDFNSPAEVSGEGHDLMKRSYWQDSYELAKVRDMGVTVQGAIDGWRDSCPEGMRIDQIWCNKMVVVTSSQVVFDGTKYPVVSDHYGVMINYERSIV